MHVDDVLARMFRDLLAADHAREQLLVDVALHAFEVMDRAILDGGGQPPEAQDDGSLPPAA